MHITDEQLIAYLLGDASSELRRHIESRLPNDEDLADRLQQFRQVLGHMDSLAGPHEPPCDLIESTLERIDAAAQREGAAADASESSASGDTQRIGLRPLRPELQPAGSKRNFWDSGALALSLLLLCCMILPAMVEVRSGARRNQCADNLRTIGWNLISYAMGDPATRFPEVGNDDLTGFAGIFPVRLRSAGFPIRYSQLQCPSLIGCSQADKPIDINVIPTLAELAEIDPAELPHWKCSLGGDMAFSLGVLEKDQIVAPRYEGRADFAILSDAPVFEASQERMIAHGGEGANFLFEDGRIAFIRWEGRVHYRVGDYPFQNLVGRHAAGLTASDISLAPSYFSTAER